MSIDADQSLSRAYDLIEEDRLDEALAILEPILENDKDNADAWWLYAHAVTDPDRAREALSNIRRIDSDYPGVDQLIRTLESQSSIAPINKAQQSSLLPPVPATLPGMQFPEEDDDDWDALDEAKEEDVPIWRRPSFLLIAGLLIFLVVAALVIFRPGVQPSASATATEVASSQALNETPTAEIFMPVDTAVLTPLVSVTDIPIEQATDMPAETFTPAEEGENTDLLAAFSNLTLSETGITTEQTDLGNTLLVNVCTAPGSELRGNLDQVMSILAEQVNNITEDVDAVGARMLDCSTESVLLMIGATSIDIMDYSNGNLTEEQFQAQWMPIG